MNARLSPKEEEKASVQLPVRFEYERATSAEHALGRLADEVRN